MRFYVLIPLRDENGKIIGSRIYRANPQDDGTVGIHKNNPPRIEYYKAWSVLRFENEIYMMTNGEPIRIERLRGDEDDEGSG